MFLFNSFLNIRKAVNLYKTNRFLYEVIRFIVLFSYLFFLVENQ